MPAVLIVGTRLPTTGPRVHYKMLREPNAGPRLISYSVRYFPQLGWYIAIRDVLPGGTCATLEDLESCCRDYLRVGTTFDPVYKTAQKAIPHGPGRRKEQIAGLGLREHLVAEAVSYLSNYSLEVTKCIWPLLFEFCDYAANLLKRCRDPIALTRVRSRFTEALENADEFAPGLLEHLVGCLQKLSWLAILYRTLRRNSGSQAKAIDEFTDEEISKEIMRRLGRKELAPDTVCKVRRRLACDEWYRFELCIRACFHVLNPSDSFKCANESNSEWISTHQNLPCLEFIDQFLESFSQKRVFHREGRVDIGWVRSPRLGPAKKRNVQ